MKILITGAAGYIGSHTAQHLLNQDAYHVSGIDNYSMGHRGTPGVDIRRATLPDQGSGFISSFSPDTIIHLAAHSRPGESLDVPFDYLLVNPQTTLKLAQIARVCGVKRFVFASTANVYGQSIMTHSEDDELEPQTPYGAGKLMSEIALDWIATTTGMEVVCLRFFNVVGGHHNSYTHMIPNMLRSVANGDPFQLYGTDYPTPDGTCIRDLIHIWDVTKAIELAATTLPQGVYNVCSGFGTSVKQVCDALRVDYEPAQRRGGDPPYLVGNNAKLRSFGWKPSSMRDDLLKGLKNE